jgi:hypothetical protein
MVKEGKLSPFGRLEITALGSSREPGTTGEAIVRKARESAEEQPEQTSLRV